MVHIITKMKNVENKKNIVMKPFIKVSLQYDYFISKGSL